MKKEKKILKKVTSIMLLMTLTMAQFLYVTTTVVQAVYEELESQSINIENTNVSFNVSYEDGTHSKQLKISEGGVISCNIKIEKDGVLNNAKIHIENPNFKINEEKLDKTFVKAVDVENNDITLNQIVTGEKNIKIPVKFEKKEIVTSDYFDKQNTFTFAAEYKVENKVEKRIQKNIIVDTQWTDDIDTNIENEFLKSFLYYVPYVTLAVMTFPAILHATESPLSGALALIIGIIAAWAGAGLLPVAVICCVVVLIAEWFL